MRALFLRVWFLYVVVIAAFAVGSAEGQDLMPAPGRLPPPQLVIATPVDFPVRLKEISVRAQVSGSMAITEISMLFYNPNRRVLEGELSFPLLDGQQVLGFALDVNGRLRDAVPVEKARGRAVFEDVTRAQIDPGLLETTQGNNFKLRVYPIPALGTKQVVLRYSQALGERNGRSIYRLPLDYASTVEQFRLDIDVTGATVPPAVTRGGIDGLEFARSTHGYHGVVTREKYAGRGLLELEIARARGAQAFTQTFEGKTYFYAEVPVASREVARALPNVVGLIWDSSGSGAARDHGREFALLDAYFRQVRDAEVRLIRVRDMAEAAQSIRVVNGDWRALRAALEATVYDGATQLGAVEPDTRVREYLLFSDGLANYGERPMPKISVPLYTISAATSADAVALKHLAEASGGRFIDLISDSATAARRKLLYAATRVTTVAADGAADVVLHSPYPERGRIAIAGRLTEQTTRLALTLAQPGAKAVTITVPVRAGEAPFALAAPLWARFRIEALEANYDINRAEIRRLGQAFRLVTRETSLIVLDRVEDYVRHEITPPAELLAEYERLRQAGLANRKADRSRHLAQIIARFEEKSAWWNRDFPKGAKPDAQPNYAPAESSLPGSPRQEAPMRERAQRPAATPAPQMLRDQAAGNVAAKRADAETPATTATIRLQKWEPDAPYSARLRKATKSDVYRAYLDERPSYAASTAFFLDVADILCEKGESALALRVLSNLAEMDLENRHILRILAYRLLQAQQPALAIPLLRKVVELAPDEPQSFRDLGLALAADRRYQEAIDALYEVAIRPWHGRFPDIELIALAELNAIVATAGQELDVSRIEPKLLKNLPLDVRAVLTWDADNTDIDLWVTDPNGEKAYYGHQLTYQGGRMSLDFTGGYGPEEFSLKRAKPGKYQVEAQYYGDRQQSITGPTTLMLKLTTKFGLREQREQMITLRLQDKREVVLVGEFEIN